MAFHKAWKLLVFVLLCSSCYAQLSPVELQQVEYNVNSDKNDVNIIKDVSSTENETSQNDPKGNDIEEPFKKATKPPYCLGCVISVPPEQPGVNEMVERAVSAMDQLVAAPTIHAMPRVLGVQKQVVNGIQYYIQIEVSLSDCPQSTSSSRDQCNPLPDSPSIICEVIFLNQPWKNPKPQLMGNNCTDANSDNNVENFTPDDLLAVERSSGEESTYPMPQENGETQRSTETKLETTSPVIEDTLSGENEDRNGRTVNVGTGMLKAMDSSEIDLINELVDIAVRTLNELETGDSRKQVIDIVDAKKQIVNGLMYHLVLRVGSKSCADKTADCQMQGWATQSICNVQLHRSWAEDAPYKAKVVNSECEETWEEGREARHLTGNWVLQDMYDPEHSDCIKEVLSKAYNIVPKDIVTLSSLMRQDVSPKSIQMVAELKLPINKSMNPISDRKETLVLRPMVVCKHDAEKSSVTESADPTDIPTVLEVESSRTKRSPQTETQNIPGGLRDSDKNSAEVRAVVDFAVKELDKSSNSGYEKKAVEVIEAKQQVVAGVLYHLKIKVANCKKGETLDCVQDHEVCSLKVWSRPWLNSNEVSDLSCSPSRSKRSVGPVFGGVEDADKNAAGVQEASAFAVNELTKREGTNSKLVLLEVVDAKKQVVQGISYHLTLKVSESNCNKEDSSVSNCQALPDGKQELCSLKVWSKPWLNETSVHDVDCKARRSKRAANNIPGGLSDADKNSAEVQAAVDFAVTELAKSSNRGYEKKAVEVIEAKQQVVAGVLYHLKIKVANCKKGETSDCVQDREVCSLKVWSRPWLNSMEVSDVNCSPSRSKKSVVGDLKDVEDLQDPYIQDIAEYSRSEIDKTTNSRYSQKVVRVIEAKKQVVSGVLVHLKLELVRTGCSKKTKDLSSCQALPDQKSQICEVKIWDRPWLKVRKVKSMKCADAQIISSQEPAIDATEILFSNFVNQFNKKYDSELERQKRFEIFKENLNIIKELQDTEQGTATYGPTVFADLTHEQFKEHYLGLKPDLHQENSVPFPRAEIPNVQLPKEFDWRDHNAVTPVKNQGMCGSCWAFAVTGNVEGQYALKYKKLLSFSEQELVDCDKLDDGCQGGLPDSAYRALEQLGGLELEEEYPYEGKGESCALNKTLTRVRIHGGLNISSNETDMAKWLVQNGPIAIGINANAMQFYMGGVSHPLKFLCSPSSLDHGVLIVGFGEHRTRYRKKLLPYWLIKNSWGKFWGEQGYYRVYRGDGSCGVNMMASSAIIE